MIHELRFVLEFFERLRFFVRLDFFYKEAICLLRKAVFQSLNVFMTVHR